MERVLAVHRDLRAEYSWFSPDVNYAAAAAIAELVAVEGVVLMQPLGGEVREFPTEARPIAFRNNSDFVKVPGHRLGRGCWVARPGVTLDTILRVVPGADDIAARLPPEFAGTFGAAEIAVAIRAAGGLLRCVGPDEDPNATADRATWMTTVWLVPHEAQFAGRSNADVMAQLRHLKPSDAVGHEGVSLDQRIRELTVMFARNGPLQGDLPRRRNAAEEAAAEALARESKGRGNTLTAREKDMKFLVYDCATCGAVVSHVSWAIHHRAMH